MAGPGEREETEEGSDDQSSPGPPSVQGGASDPAVQGEASAAHDDASPAAEGDPDRGVGTFLYRMALAGVGALVLAQEELEGRLRKLRGERGEGAAAADGAPAAGEGSAPDEAPPKADDQAEDAEPRASRHTEAATPPRRTLAEHIDVTVSRVLQSLHVPTRGEVDELARRVEEIRRRLETLRR